MQQQEEVQEMQDTVNHPNHYNKNPNFETIKVLKAWMSPESYEGFLVGNTIKYLSRYKLKNGQEDVKKAFWYLTELTKEYDNGYLNEETMGTN
jgi:hypothetical protein